MTQETPEEIIARLSGERIPQKKVEDPMDRLFHPEKYVVVSELKNDQERYEKITIESLDYAKKIQILNDISDEKMLAKLTERLNDTELKLKALGKIQSPNIIGSICTSYASTDIMIAAFKKLNPKSDQKIIEDISFRCGDQEVRIEAIKKLDYDMWRRKIIRLADEVKNVATNTAQNEAAFSKLKNTPKDLEILRRIADTGKSFESEGKHHHKMVRELAKERIMQLTGLF